MIRITVFPECFFKGDLTVTPQFIMLIYLSPESQEAVFDLHH
jgi:hypothetical protein